MQGSRKEAQKAQEMDGVFRVLRLLAAIGFLDLRP
jgi:hypothetical protein